MTLSTAQLDRACGALLAAAAGDALGAGYEFGPPLPLGAPVDLHERTGHTAGNGSLMRTAPVALAFLDDPGGLTEAATAISALAHHDPDAGEACVPWCHAIRHAVLTGTLDARAGLEWLPGPSRVRWAGRLTQAEHARTGDFTRNGRVAEALQAAWCAIATTGVPGDDPAAGSFRAGHLRLALEEAVRRAGRA